MKVQIFSIGALVMLSACDRIYGVSSKTTLESPVSISCVSSALSSVTGSGPVDYVLSERNSVEILPKQRRVGTVMHVWLYGEGQLTVLQINQTPDGWDFTNTRSRMNEAVSQEEIARSIPLMREVNRAIQDRCGLPVANLSFDPDS